MELPKVLSPSEQNEAYNKAWSEVISMSNPPNEAKAQSAGCVAIAKAQHAADMLGMAGEFVRTVNKAPDMKLSEFAVRFCYELREKKIGIEEVRGDVSESTRP